MSKPSNSKSQLSPKDQSILDMLNQMGFEAVDVSCSSKLNPYLASVEVASAAVDPVPVIGVEEMQEKSE